MRTTVTIDDELLAEVKVLAARTHQTIGSVMEEALRRLIAEHEVGATIVDFSLPELVPDRPGLRAGVDLFDAEQMAELLGDNEPDAVS